MYQQAAGLRYDVRARKGERDTLGLVVHQELHLKSFLQPGDGQGDRGLGYVQRRGGGEVAMLGRGNQIVDLLHRELHRIL